MKNLHKEELLKNAKNCNVDICLGWLIPFFYVIIWDFAFTKFFVASFGPIDATATGPGPFRPINPALSITIIYKHTFLYYFHYFAEISIWETQHTMFTLPVLCLIYSSFENVRKQKQKEFHELSSTFHFHQ